MNRKRLIFLLVFSFVFLFTLSAQAASANRYFIKSNNGFWKNTFNARHEFENGFTADLTDWQLRIAKVFNVEFTSVHQLEILLEEVIEEEVKAKPENPGNKPDKPDNKESDRVLPSDQTPWGVEFIYDDDEIAVTSGGEGVSVAVLDTGVSSDHADLKNRVVQCKDFTHPRHSVVDGKCEDKNGHGTHVAGIALADGGSDGLGIYGVAPEASLWAYKVCGQNGSCWADDIAIAIRNAADEGVNVINLSLGSDVEVGLIRDAVNYAQEQGVLVVVAAGNDGPEFGSIDYPAAHEYSSSVGAFDKEVSVADWSSRGINSETAEYEKNAGDIEFVAPGVGIESTWKDGGYAVLSGTSMATPFVSGLAAKLWDTDAETTRLLLQNLAQDLWSPGVDDDATGFGVPTVPLIQ